MADPDVPKTPLVVRTAVWLGDAFGRWQKRRAAARDDVFVEKWKAAWSEGCEAHAAGKQRDDVPHGRSPKRDAWLAGWLWAERRGDAKGPMERPRAARDVVDA